MKFLLIGRHNINAGPMNVNRSLIENSDESMMYLKTENRIGILFEIFIKLFRADVIVVSSMNYKTVWYVVKPFLRKRKLIVLLHGYVKFENIINDLHMKKSHLEAEECFLENADLILSVSPQHAEWFKKQCPQFKSKVGYLKNGIKISRRNKIEKEPYSVAVAGGNRKIKNNIEVCHAIEKLRKKGIPCKLYIFGRLYDGNDNITSFPFVEYMGHLEKDEYYEKLDKISCLVINSEVEPFGLVVADAVNCNCSILFSQNAGAVSVVKTSPEDIIFDPHDITELSKKIERILLNGNADRLYESIDLEDVSEKKAYERLKDICMKISKK